MGSWDPRECYSFLAVVIIYLMVLIVELICQILRNAKHPANLSKAPDSFKGTAQDYPRDYQYACDFFSHIIQGWGLGKGLVQVFFLSAGISLSLVFHTSPN